MRYVVTRHGNVLEAFWCYYTKCETCPSRFKCLTSAIAIVDDCINLTGSEVRKKINDIIEKHGLHVEHLAEM